MRVVLINPPQTPLRQPTAYAPLGLCYLAAVLEQDRVDVEIVNLAATSIDSVAADDVPDATWYGITCVSAVYAEVKRLVALLKSKAPVIVGGPHPSVQPDATLRDMRPHLIVTGEAEYALRDYVRGRIEPRSIIHAGVIDNLDALPFPARHLLTPDEVVDTSGIHGQDPGVPATTVLTSRGCPYACTFCCKGHPMFTRYRYRSGANVAEELRQLVRDYGIQHVRFIDDEFTLHAARVRDLCRHVAPLGVTWICITRADTVTRDLLATMKRAGCVEVHVGVESGSDRVLRAMNKRVTVATLKRGIALIKDVGLRVKTYLMYGFPGETERDREATIDFVRQVKPDKFTVSMFTPLPGSATNASTGTGWYYPDFFIRFRERIMEALT